MRAVVVAQLTAWSLPIKKPRFETSYRQLLLNNLVQFVEKTKRKRIKEAGNSTF